jgi:hypothetical protein
MGLRQPVVEVGAGSAALKPLSAQRSLCRVNERVYILFCGIERYHCSQVLDWYFSDATAVYTLGEPVAVAGGQTTVSSVSATEPVGTDEEFQPGEGQGSELPCCRR